MWTFADLRSRQVRIFSEREQRVIWVPSYEQAALAGAYEHDAHALLEDPDRLLTSFLDKYEDRFVRDVTGRWHRLETDINEIYRLAHAYPEPFSEFYQIRVG